MIRQIILLLPAIVLCMARPDGRAFASTKNVQFKQDPPQYASIAAFHAPRSSASQQPQEIQQAPSPYSFNYADDGSSRQESGDSNGRVTGQYTVTNEDGSTRVVKYEADDQGFRADVDTDEPGTKSDNPADVPLQYAVAARQESNKFASGRNYGQVKDVSQFEEQKTLQFDIDSPKRPFDSQSQIDFGNKDFAKASTFNPASAASKRPTTSEFTSHVSHQQQQKQIKTYSQPQMYQAPVQEQFSKPSPYAFNYEAKLEDGSSSRSESSDGSGKVIGSYSLTDADGRKRIISYQADHEGFRASVDTNEFGTKSDSPADVKFLSTAPLEEPIAFKRPSFQQRPQSSGTQFRSSFQQQQHSIKSGSGSSSFQPQSASGSTSQVKSSFHQQQNKQISKPATVATSPARPSFQVQQQKQVKSGSGLSGLVKSTFQQASKPVASSWRADSIGQVKSSSHQSDHRQPIKSASASATSQFKPAFQTTNQQSVKTASASTNMYSSSGLSQPAVHFNSAPFEKPSPYAFDYFAQLDDGSSSRRESADENGRVTGSYTLTVADGRQRTVDYIADHEGFRATVNTNEFGTKEESPADVQFYSSATFDEPAPYFSPNAYRASASSATLNAASFSGQQKDRTPIQFTMGSKASEDKNFPFYQQTEEDTKDFEKKTDFQDRDRTLSSTTQQKFEAPRVPIAFMVPASDAIEQISQEAYEPSQGMYQMPMYNQQQVQEPSYPRHPYNFNYQADTDGSIGGSSREESSDKSGKVTGRYSVTNEDGSVRVVEYIADEGGFRANVQTNEPGTKSEDPADVVLRSDAPEPKFAPAPVRNAFLTRNGSKKSGEFSQQTLEDWRR